MLQIDVKTAKYYTPDDNLANLPFFLSKKFLNVKYSLVFYEVKDYHRAPVACGLHVVSPARV
jgi:hypothetical protein